ncbi:hypothetical protein B5E41_10290 [Rhizobium esperanzae]|uniref:Uncharacterized protein n=1 Tax=Rhizobium esperanzae TaxID=1967781 RepID=A0A246DWT6_9HYPH|nr:hypothetical protein B5E41_10290 [Rhizobium esperanzae]
MIGLAMVGRLRLIDRALMNGIELAWYRYLAIRVDRGDSDLQEPVTFLFGYCPWAFADNLFGVVVLDFELGQVARTDMFETALPLIVFSNRHAAASS